MYLLQLLEFDPFPNDIVQTNAVGSVISGTSLQTLKKFFLRGTCNSNEY